MTNIYFGSPSVNTPRGGIKQAYRHVDLLNKNGFSSFIVHEEPGFRCTWFENRTKVVSLSDIETSLTSKDYIVLPETLGTDINKIKPGIRKVIFNQNSYYTFLGYDLDKNLTAYLHKDTAAVIVVSEDNLNYLKYVFPQLTIFRIHNAIDPNIFQYSSEKKKQIAFSTNKNYDDLVQVINILKFRGTIADYQLVPISAKSEKEVAEILKESSIFLSFVNGEGFGLLAAEAMSCGCIVVGYDGMGGKEFFNTSFCYPVQQPDVINFAKNVEKVISAYEKNPDLIRAQAKKASVFINSTYSLQKEESDIVAVWTKLLNQ